MGAKSTQQNSNTSSTTPAALSQLQDIYSRISGAASQPYKQYTGELTAGLTDQQKLGITNLNNAASSAQPYYGQAANYATQAGASISPDQIEKYQNPYTQSVIGATQRQFNEQNGQQQQQVLGNAASQGALGGDRSAVAQGILAGQQQLAQAPVIAGLNSQAYQQALQAAQSDRSAAGNAASLYGNLGTSAQNAGISGAQAQIGAGTLEQQTNQARDSAQQQQFNQQQAFPYQQAQFLASLGLPVASAQGSNSTGTTSTQTNPWSQLLGLGTAAVTAYSDERVKEDIEPVGKTFDGQNIYKFRYKGHPRVHVGLMAQDVEKKHPGAVGEVGGVKTVNYDDATADAAAKGKFASGGSVPGDVPNFMSAQGYIPAVQMGHVTPLTATQFPQMQSGKEPSSQSSHPLGSFLGVAAKTGHNGYNNYADPGSSANPLESLSSEDYGEGFASGGEVSFDDRWDAMFPMRSPSIAGQDDNVIPDPGLQRVSPEDVEAWRKSVDQTAMVDKGAPSQNPMHMALPKEIMAPDGEHELPDDMSAYSAPRSQTPFSVSPPGQPQEQTQPAQPTQPQSKFGSFNPFGLSDNARQALIAGGLGVASSKNPNLLGAVGEGGLHGLKAYTEANAADIEQGNKKETQDINKRRVDLEAQRIAQSAEQFARNYGLKKRELDQGYQPKYGVIGEDPTTGTKRYGWIDPNTQKVTPDTSLPTLKPSVDANGDPLTGEPYLKTLSPGQAAIVKKIANYEIPASSLSIRGGHREQLLMSASRYNPEFDSTSYPARAAAVKSFATGPHGNSIRSFDVAIDHLNTLDEAAKAMQNGDIQLLNSIRNKYREQTGSELPGNFEAAKNIVGDEIVKAVIGAKGALGDREEAKKVIDNKKSPEQLSGVIREYKKLMAGQLHGLKKQYEDTTGLKNFNTRLRPSTIQELEAASSHGGANEVGAPKVGFVKGGYRFKGGNPADKNSWEKV